MHAPLLQEWQGIPYVAGGGGGGGGDGDPLGDADDQYHVGNGIEVPRSHVRKRVPNCDDDAGGGDDDDHSEVVQHQRREVPRYVRPSHPQRSEP